ncbi:translation factor GTPase family protein [Lentimicrobium sp. S6]|uniref:GTP-binding protein n=1 Tax=Lentimicrobium sp. S6 TaxID=2735872 RepID=UPI001554D512|nr:TetM/TetW/TetO/TetS family tetracycline resistance ribosomal protection protein [Lentimicrobium sp. S6]NPD48051.1 TetM/TetW/TetO/TetS family tetracycline resistance ribosomal protection protein [Lentimicrobium sp. S6]
MKPILNIALLAHVDAGKTSLTEQLLFHTGVLKSVGQVDKGTSVSDFLNVEKERGISVMASHMSLEYKKHQINIIDTPGHADFISEVEKSLLAVDMVVLVISAYEGVQAQTRIIWKLLKKLGLPVFFVVNKMDKEDFYHEDLLKEIQEELSSSAVAVQKVEAKDDIIVLKNSSNEDLIEIIAENNDAILELFVSGENIDEGLLQKAYFEQIEKALIFPVLFASAKVGLGIKLLLEHLVEFNKSRNNKSSEELEAIIFKISQDSQLGTLAHVRLFSGKMAKKQLVYNQRLAEEQKVNQLKSVFSQKLKDIEEARAGDIIAIAGFSNVQIGDVLGKNKSTRSLGFNTVPILRTQVKAIEKQDYFNLSEALTQLNLEDPLLDFQWFREEEEFHLKINGAIQIEILEQLMQDRFQLNVEFDTPSVIYKETIASEAYGYDAYTMPKPCWAVVKFQLVPGELGSGVQYKSIVGVNDVLLKYQKEVERTITRPLEQGMKGWEVTDLKITLEEGAHHNIHSKAGDFVIVTPMAIMDGLKNAGSVLLEPMMKFSIEAPEESLGGITSDIMLMRGSFEQPRIENNQMKLEGIFPAATSMDYPIKLAAKTGGRGSLSMVFDHYEKVEDDLGVIREFKGINPLDRSKYILKARKAIQ